MTQIRIDTECARWVAEQLVSAGNLLNRIGGELQSAIGSLDTWAWDGASRARAEPLLSRVPLESERVAQQLDHLGCQLTRIAEAFQQADNQSAARVEAIPWFLLESSPDWHSGTALRLGTLLAGGGGVAAIPWTRLPATAARSDAWLIERLKEIPDAVAEWLSPVLSSIAGLFGWHVTVSPQPVSWIPAPPPQPPPTISAEIGVGYATARDLTPTLKQTAGSYECAPTAVSMVLYYWNNVDPNNQVRTPQEIIQGLGERFNPRSGIDADELVAGLREMDLGYTTIERRAGLDRQGLQSELKDGPVIAMVHLNWSSNGYPHMVTVTGMSDDGQTVYVNDPWTGEATEIDWATFESSWTFGGRYSGASHLIVKIRP